MSLSNLQTLRIKYKIPLSELADILGVKKQTINRFELGERHADSMTLLNYQNAMDTLISQRKKNASELEQDYQSVRSTLFEIALEDAP